MLVNSDMYTPYIPSAILIFMGRDGKWNSVSDGRHSDTDIRNILISRIGIDLVHYFASVHHMRT